MALFKAKKSNLPPVIASVSDTNLGTAFRTKADYKFNHISKLTNGDLLASSCLPDVGFRRSTDSGKTWGSLIAPYSTTFAYANAFQSPLANGDSPAGRIWWNTLAFYSGLIFYSDTNLATYDQISGTSIYPSPRDSWVQDTLYHNILYSSIDMESIFVFDGVSFNDRTVADVTFINGRNAGVNRNAAGSKLLAISYQPNTGGNNLIGHYSVDGGTTWAAQGLVQSTQGIFKNPKQDYHISDNEFGVAMIEYGAPPDIWLEFYTVDDQSTSDLARRWYTTASDFVSIISVMARQGYSKVWMIAVECTKSTKIYQSRLGDYTHFDLILELPYTQGGPISNLIEV